MSFYWYFIVIVCWVVKRFFKCRFFGVLIFVIDNKCFCFNILSFVLFFVINIDIRKKLKNEMKKKYRVNDVMIIEK